MFRSNLFVKAFSTIVLGMLVLSTIYYFFSVPLINRMAFAIEERAGQTFLDSMHELVRQSNRDMEAWQESALAAHKRELKNIIRVVESYILDVQREASEGRIDLEEAKDHVLERVRKLKYGGNDYVWVSDYSNVLISHPDPSLHKRDFSEIEDVNGSLIVPPMVEGALKDGEGYYSYWWRRLGEEEPVEKLSYYRNLPLWEWVVGTGVYIDDVENEAAQRKKELVEELRRHIHGTRISGSGYMYIFDSDMNMIIHPNSNIENTNIANLLNPVSGKPIAQELIAASRRADKKLEYKWDKPSDPGNYVYDKISWVRYSEGNDWYIASSVYTEDLQESAHALTRRILAISALGLLLAIAGGYVFVRAFTNPIKSLAESANRISKGELAATSEISRADEIGVLAKAFNNMVEQLKDQIRNLEARVEERTSLLATRAEELESRNREIETVNAMGDMLQACRTIEEAYDVVARTIQSLFTNCSGALIVIDNSRQILETAARWGNSVEDDQVFGLEGCWGIRRGKTHMVRDGSRDQLCSHVRGDRPGDGPYFCTPLIAQGNILGVLHVLLEPEGEADRQAGMDWLREKGRMAETVAEHAALAIANMRLQQSLHMQSIRDPLTGLLNRRHLDEILTREGYRAGRHGLHVGIIMIDVDHFKRLNDTYGHEAGDEVLRALGKELTDLFREEDSACRYGGEEFTVVLPGANAEMACRRAEELRRHVEDRIKPVWNNQSLDITASLGVAVFPDNGGSLEEVVKAADKALYEAKAMGRNRVVSVG
jgi:diguanylate cyclase (GGDEF)-like protein